MHFENERSLSLRTKFSVFVGLIARTKDKEKEGPGNGIFRCFDWDRGCRGKDGKGKESGWKVLDASMSESGGRSSSVRAGEAAPVSENLYAQVPFQFLVRKDANGTAAEASDGNAPATGSAMGSTSAAMNNISAPVPVSASNAPVEIVRSAMSRIAEPLRRSNTDAKRVGSPSPAPSSISSDVRKFLFLLRNQFLLLT